MISESWLTILAAFLKRKDVEGEVRDKKTGEHIAYQDEALIWTIGYGNTFIDGKPVYPGQRITEAKALQALDQFVRADHARLMANKPYEFNIRQIAALLSFSYNAGIGGLLTSQLWQAIKAKDNDKIKSEWRRWKYVTVRGQKVVSDGLVNRRELELKLFYS